MPSFSHHDCDFFFLWKIAEKPKAAAKLLGALCVNCVCLNISLVYTGKTSSAPKCRAVSEQDLPQTGARKLKVLCTQDTLTYTLTFLQQESVAIQWWRGGQVCLPITMPLSVCLGLWVLIQICGDSHTETHTHSLWLIRESWQGLLWSYTTRRYIILLRSWVNCWTFSRIFPEGSIVWNTLKKFFF